MSAGALAILVVFFLFTPFHPVLTLTAVKAAKELGGFRMKEGEEFTFSFIHSINKRPVYDTLRVKGDQLLIVKSRFDSFGGGMPDASTDTMKLQLGEDGWVESILSHSVPEITFFLGWVANHSLRIRGRNIPLTNLAEPGTLLSLKIRKMSYYDLWKNGYRE
jgi:hypothetical protein